MKKIIHIWPKNRFKFNNFFSIRLYSSANIELILRKKFMKQGYPVLVSSGRVGIILCLISKKLNKNDSVNIFPYASHCVKEAISRIATPVLYKKNNNADINIIYHQYGFVQNNYNKGEFLEDAVDSLVDIKGKIFPLGGSFEIWSLSKILGSIGGGIIWCKNKKISEQIKKIRDRRKKFTNFSWFLKILSIKFSFLSPLWQGIETLGGPIPNWTLKQIQKDIEDWGSVVSKRRKRYKILKDFIPTWLKVDINRIPCVLPVALSKAQIQYIENMGFVYGHRHFEKINKNKSNQLIKLFMISIHQDVPINLLIKIKEILKK